MLERGRGSHVWDADDNEYLDFSASVGVANTGYGHPHLLEAVIEQVNKMTAVNTLIFQNTACLLLADKLTKITPGNFRKKVWFGNSCSPTIRTKL